MLGRRLCRQSSWKKCISVLQNRNYYQRRFEDDRKARQFSKSLNYLLGGAACVLTTGYVYSQKTTVLYSAEKEQLALMPPQRPDLPTFKLNDISKHREKATGIWTTFKQGVYDITEFVELHPGGDKIMLAAGASLDPFWSLYAQHKTDEVMGILEELRIGNLDPVDLEIQQRSDAANEFDPFGSEPRRHPALVHNSLKPFNAETPPSMLTDSFYTPNELFFVRNHLPVPQIDESEHELEISGLGLKREVTMSVAQLKRGFKPVTVSSAVQCAGNRRYEMSTFKHVNGLSWTHSAISNATWTGVPLKDILVSAGFDPKTSSASHVHFEGCDIDPTGQHYGTSIPIEKALSPEVLVAYEMNGKPIPPDHGFPLRLIVPGFVGARQVKWLTSIEISSEESPSHWQQKDYRMLSPSVQWGDHIDYTTAPAIQEAPVQSAICSPANGAKLIKAGDIVVVGGSKHVEMKGYAWSGGGKSIVRVDVSADDAKTWQSAYLQQEKGQELDKMWAWTLWSVTVPVPEGHNGRVNLLCKATDRNYNTQPESPAGIWNVRGLLNNSWHKIQVEIPVEETRD